MRTAPSPPSPLSLSVCLCLSLPPSAPPPSVSLFHSVPLCFYPLFFLLLLFSLAVPVRLYLCFFLFFFSCVLLKRVVLHPTAKSRLPVLLLFQFHFILFFFQFLSLSLFFYHHSCPSEENFSISEENHGRACDRV